MGIFHIEFSRLYDISRRTGSAVPGSSREARRAGQSPKKIPTAAEAATPGATGVVETWKGISASRQTGRPRSFPQSVVLCGVRDVRDYRIHSSTGKALVAGGSAFNVKAESLRLGDFSRDEVLSLLAQHTAETGQGFTPEAIETVWEQSRGQPWLVNALAYEACFRCKAMRERTRTVTAETILDAREALVAQRATHIEQLTDKLEEERVRRVGDVGMQRPVTPPPRARPAPSRETPVPHR